MGENIVTEARATTVMGILIVFGVLLILMLVLYAMQVIFKGKKQPEAKEEAPAVVPQAQQAAQMPEEELIAVLTAAVAASMGAASTYGLQIKSYRKISDNNPVWNQMSRRENIMNQL